MTGLTLERSEFLVLMDAVKAPAVVGLDTASLVPTNQEQHKALVLEGLEKLKQRGLLRVDGDVNVLDARLLALAAAVGRPDVAVITRKDTPGLGSQLFLHYLAPPLIVEQTLPSERQHRLVPLEDMPTLIERLLAILPVQESRALPNEHGVMPMDVFLAMKAQAESGDRVGAQSLARQSGLSATGADSLPRCQAASDRVSESTVTIRRVVSGAKPMRAKKRWRSASWVTAATT